MGWDTAPDLNRQLTIFCQLNETIPFERLDSNPWLLDPSTNLDEHATRPVQAEKLSDVWVARDPRSLHAVLRRLKTPSTSPTPHF